MARLNPSPIRMYRGTTAQHSQYAGPIGELTVDTDKNTVVVQNGTQGGVPLAQEKRQVIAGDGITVNGGASGTLASDLTVAIDQTWLEQNVPAGPQGEPGPAGEDGAPGAAATVAVGSVTTGAAGTQASVTNAGTANAAVLNFTIPRGAKGDKGDTGATGPAGEYTEGTGISLSNDSISVDQTWLDSYIDGLVNGGSLVTAGDGVDVTASGGVAEIAVDDTVVRTSGDQTISGRKIFNTDVFIQQDISCDVYTVHSAATKGTAPAENALARFILTDSTGLENVSTTTCRLGSMDLSYSTTGNTTACILAYKPEQGSTENAAVTVVYPASGDPYATAPSTRATPDDNEIITYDFLQQYVEANGGGSLGTVSDIALVSTGSFRWQAAGYQESGGTASFTFTVPSGGTWIVAGTFTWTRLGNTYSSGSMWGRYAGGSSVQMRDSTTNAGAGSGSFVRADILCFRIG